MRLLQCLLFLFVSLCSPWLLAATCQSVFPAAISGNSPNQLDLNGVAWQNSPALGASNRSLGAGDHYFGGGSTGNNWTLTTTGGASTRVFVNGGLTLSNNSQLNAGGNPQNLILVVNGSLAVGNNVTIRGFVYATGGISFGNNLTLDGAITSAGAASSPGGSSSLTYNGSAINLVDFASLCEASTQLRLGWSLDESSWTGAAGEVLDSSGNGLAGTVFNAAQTTSTAPALPTVDGDGTCRYGGFTSSSQQYVQRADTALLDLQGSFSIGLWVKPNSLPSSDLMTILSKDENYEFHLKPDGKINWWWQTTAGATNQLDSSASLTVGQWSHVLIRHAPGDQRIYINGALAGSASFSGTPVANSDPLQLGSDQGFAGRYFNGSLDELRIYAAALSSAQITALVQERHSCPLALQCVNDDFNRSGLGTDWAATTSGGSFGVPVIVSNRMRLTDSSNNVATSSTLQRLFPAAGNYVQVQFKHYAYNGSGADGVAVVLSDASVTPQAGSYGGPLGYGTRGTSTTPGFAGGWLGVGVDEYGNFSTEGGGATANGPGQRPDSVALRGSGASSRTTGYSYIAGTAANLSPGIDVAGSTAGPGHTYRITMDGRVSGSALVTVERDSGAGFVALSGLNGLNVAAVGGQAPLPANFYLSFTGSSGGSTNTHELDDLQVCASQINPVEQQIDHFELVHAGNALTCNPLDVLVRACLDASCATPYTGSVTVNLLPSGWVGGNSQTFSGGSTTLQLRNNTASTVTLGVSGSTPSLKPFSQTLCSAGGALSSSCTVPFADSGFIVTVPDMLAAKLTTGSIRAVKTDDATQACVPGFPSGPRTVQFSSAYVSPDTGTQPVVVNGASVTSALTDVTLDFDAAASAPLSVRYDDAGLMTLNARYAPTSGDENGLEMTDSDQFVSKPYGLCLQTASTLSDTTDCSDASCALFPGGIRAGDSFPLTIRAVGWQADGEALTAAQLCSGNITTPNFRHSGITLGSLVQAPAGGDDGSQTPSSYDHALGSATNVDVAISEVGVFTLSASPTTNYFGETVSGGTSGPVGRFIPAYLGVAGSASLTPSCGSAFSYQGQPIGFASNLQPTLIVTAYNRGDQVTRNYDRGAFWKLAAPAVGGYTSVTGLAALDARLSSTGTALQGVSGADNGDGARTYSWTGEQLLYQPASLPGSDDYPFTAKIRQSFPVASLKETDLTQDVCYGTGSGCLAYSYDFSDSPGSQVLLGRLHIGNAHGSELQGLDLPVRLESWQTNPVPVTGSSFQVEGLDTCTASALSAPALTGHTGELTSGDYGNDKVSLVALVGGQGILRLQAPGKDGSVEAYFQEPPALTWLYYDWRGLGREPAKGLATFGVYKGATPLIFRRELYR